MCCCCTLQRKHANVHLGRVMGGCAWHVMWEAQGAWDVACLWDLSKWLPICKCCQGPLSFYLVTPPSHPSLPLPFLSLPHCLLSPPIAQPSPPHPLPSHPTTPSLAAPPRAPPRGGTAAACAHACATRTTVHNQAPAQVGWAGQSQEPSMQASQSRVPVPKVSAQNRPEPRRTVYVRPKHLDWPRLHAAPGVLTRRSGWCCLLPAGPPKHSSSSTGRSRPGCDRHAGPWGPALGGLTPQQQLGLTCSTLFAGPGELTLTDIALCLVLLGVRQRLQVRARMRACMCERAGVHACVCACASVPMWPQMPVRVPAGSTSPGCLVIGLFAALGKLTPANCTLMHCACCCWAC